MNINELEELAKEWDRFDEGNEYSQSFLELIDAYLEAVVALRAMVSYARTDRCGLKIAYDALDTAKRLGVE